MENALIQFPRILLSLHQLSTTWEFKLHQKKSSIKRLNLAPCINISRGKSYRSLLGPLSESGLLENAVFTNVSTVMQFQALSFI